MNCCGGGNNKSDGSHEGHGAGGGGGQNGINWVQIVSIGIALLFLVNIFLAR